jgi:hypothetical protein
MVGRLRKKGRVHRNCHNSVWTDGLSGRTLVERLCFWEEKSHRICLPFSLGTSMDTFPWPHAHPSLLQPSSATNLMGDISIFMALVGVSSKTQILSDKMWNLCSAEMNTVL